MTEPTPIPRDVASDIYTLADLCVPDDWDRFEDRTTDVWHETGETYDGDRIMLPSASGLPLMLRRDAERLYGPLTPVPWPTA